MTKQKREIFTIIGVVPNWFAASTNTVAGIEEEEVTNCPRLVSVGEAQARGDDQSARGVANEADANTQPHEAQRAGTGSVVRDRGANNWLGVNLVGDRRTNVSHQGAEVDPYPSDVAQPGARDPVTLELCRIPGGGDVTGG